MYIHLFFFPFKGERPPPMGGPSLSTAEAPLEVIGGDANTHNKTIDTLQQEGVDPAAAAKNSHVPEAPDTKKAYEALAAVSSLQDQLL